MKPVDEQFRENVRRYPDNVAIRYYYDERWESVNYTELYHAVNIMAAGLAELGVGKGSLVALMSENRPEWFVCYLAIVTIGGIAVPIDSQLGETETRHILNHSGSETIFCSMRCYDVVNRIMTDLTSLKKIILFDRNYIIRHDHNGSGDDRDLVQKGQKNNRHKQFYAYGELRTIGRDRLIKGEIIFSEKSIDDLASIIYTSGTTGLAKGVMLTHKNLAANVRQISDLIKFGPSDNFLLLLPLHHAFPFTTCLTLPLSRGSSVSFVDILSRNRTRLIQECKPTIMIGVPLLYSKIYQGIIRQIEESKLKSLLFKYGGKKIIGRALKKKLGGELKLVISGAAPMDPSIIDGFRSLGLDFLEGYGLTETSPVVSANPPWKVKIGSVGAALPGVQVKIINPDPEGIGEIAVKGDNVMKGYYKSSELTDSVIRDGWFHTGDLGNIDEDGFIFITGRAKDVIVTSGGKNVYPDVVEHEINKSRIIAESVVIGYKTKGKVGEDVGVLIYPDYEALILHARKEGMGFADQMNPEEITEDDKDALIAAFKPLLESEVRNCMNMLAPYQRVTRIVIERDEFVKTSTRKIKRFLYKGRLDIVDID